MKAINCMTDKEYIKALEDRIKNLETKVESLESLADAITGLLESNTDNIGKLVELIKL